MPKKQKKPVKPAKKAAPKERQLPKIDFYKALKAVEEGFKITKVEWNNLNFYVVLNEHKLQLHKDDNRYYDWIVSDSDMVGKDWVVLK